LGFFTNALVFWYGSTLLRNREYNITQFFVWYNLYTPRLTNSFMALTVGAQAAGQFFSFAPDISKAKSSSVNVNRLMERVPLIDSWSGKGKHIEGLEAGHLEFKDVHFRYPTRPHVPVLRGLNIEVKPGQYVALVGSSGCGKSTAVALIERFYDPLVGRVLVDGMEVSGYNLSDYRKSISLVSQEPTYIPPISS
jgi:ATP-binding cassette, subfamily B (MDR/TAP), member 1